jgi:hypothetical protein
MFNNLDCTCNFTSTEDRLKIIENTLFDSNNNKWIKDSQTKDNQLRYFKKYNELDLIEINIINKDYYTVLVPINEITYSLHFKEKSFNKMLQYVNKFI